MIYQNDYPAISSLRGNDSPFEILQKIQEYHDITQVIDGNIIRIESYKKTWFKNKKVLDVSIRRIIDADVPTMTFDKYSNGKIFGIVVIKNGKEIYRALYDTGVLLLNITSIKKLMAEKSVEYLMVDDLRMYQFCSNRVSMLSSLLELHNKIEKLFD